MLFQSQGLYVTCAVAHLIPSCLWWAVSSGAHFIFLYSKWGVSRNTCWTLRAETFKFRLLHSSFADISILPACLTRFLLSMAEGLEWVSGRLLVFCPMGSFRKFCARALERLSCLAMHSVIGWGNRAREFESALHWKGKPREAWLMLDKSLIGTLLRKVTPTYYLRTMNFLLDLVTVI